MKHKILLITLTCLIFCAICLICVKELFTVKDITVNYSVKSEETEEVLSLLEKYKKQSIFSIDENLISEEIMANRYLKVVSVEKNYPNELIISLVERTERYYYVSASGVYYFDEEFFIVRREDVHTPKGEPLIKIGLTDAEGGAIEVECAVKSIFQLPLELNAQIGQCLSLAQSVSENVKELNVLYTDKEDNYRITLNMVEGVCIEIRKAGADFEQKVTAGINFYLSLEESRKIGGTIVVYLDDNSVIQTVHTFN